MPSKYWPGTASSPGFRRAAIPGKSKNGPYEMLAMLQSGETRLC